MPPSVVRSVMGGTVRVKLRLVQWAGRTSLVRTQISRQRTSIAGVSTALSINTLISKGTRQVSLPRRLSRVELIRHRRSLTRTVGVASTIIPENAERILPLIKPSSTTAIEVGKVTRRQHNFADDFEGNGLGIWNV